MPDAVESVGQHVDQEAADELVGGQPHDLLTVTVLDPVILPVEGDTVSALALIRRLFEIATRWV